MGKRMFEAGEHAWPEDAPFHTPVFVVTHEQRDPLGAGQGRHHLPLSSTTGIQSAPRAGPARAAGHRDVRHRRRRRHDPGVRGTPA